MKSDTRYVVTNSLTLDVVECRTMQEAEKVQKSFKEQGTGCESPALIYTSEEFKALTEE